MMEPAMLDGVPQRACDRFLAGYFVKRLRAPFARDHLIGHLIRLVELLSFVLLPMQVPTQTVTSGNLK